MFTGLGFGGGGSRTALLPGTKNNYDPRYGGVPGVPNPGATAGSAVMANLNNLPNIAALTTGLDTSSGAGVMAALEQEIPGIRPSIGAATSNINELLSGAVPQDVINQIAQGSAEIGAGQGMGPMSPFSNANYLRALGLTSLGMKEKGASELNALMGSVPRAPSFDPSTMTVTPRDQQEAEYMAQLLANAPVPAAAAKANEDALHAGTGYAPPSVGGFNLPVRGGPAFAPEVPTPEYNPGVVFGSPQSTWQYPETDPNAAYRNWQAEQAKWGLTPSPGQTDLSYDPEIAAMDQSFNPLDLGITPEDLYGYTGEEGY